MTQTDRNPRPTLGTLLNSLRSRRGWSLKQMSEKAGIPLSTLSKVEHDHLTLSYDKIQQLAGRLGIAMSELFVEPEGAAESLVTARRSFGRLGDSVEINTKNYDYNYLCPDIRRKLMIPVITKVKMRTLEEFGELIRHPGEEYIYILDGSVVVCTEFYGPATLGPGESIYIDSNMGHAYLLGPDCTAATLLAVCASVKEGVIETLLLNSNEENAFGALPGVVSSL
ncbi:transcriptional regulator with XRE-family HTH domain [Sphingomonas sp. UYAg733]